MNTIDSAQLKQELLQELALVGLSSEKQDALLDQMLEALLRRIFLETMEELGEGGVEEYEKLLNQNPDEKVVAEFLERKIPGYDTFVNKIILQFKQDVKATAAG